MKLYGSFPATLVVVASFLSLANCAPTESTSEPVAGNDHPGRDGLKRQVTWGENSVGPAVPQTKRPMDPARSASFTSFRIRSSIQWVQEGEERVQWNPNREEETVRQLTTQINDYVLKYFKDNTQDREVYFGAIFMKNQNEKGHKGKSKQKLESGSEPLLVVHSFVYRSAKDDKGNPIFVYEEFQTDSDSMLDTNWFSWLFHDHMLRELAPKSEPDSDRESALVENLSLGHERKGVVFLVRQFSKKARQRVGNDLEVVKEIDGVPGEIPGNWDELVRNREREMAKSLDPEYREYKGPRQSTAGFLNWLDTNGIPLARLLRSVG